MLGRVTVVSHCNVRNSEGCHALWERGCKDGADLASLRFGFRCPRNGGHTHEKGFVNTVSVYHSVFGQKLPKKDLMKLPQKPWRCFCESHSGIGMVLQ